MKTERLTIRFIEEYDWQSIQAIWMDFKHSEYVYYDTPKDTVSENVRNKIAKWAEVTRNGKDHLFFVSCLEDKVIGFTSMNISEGEYDMGYAFLDKYQGKGYAKESLTAILDYMKSIGAKKITAGTALKNSPSVRLLDRLGFKLIGTEYLSFHKDSNENDIIFKGGNFEKLL